LERTGLAAHVDFIVPNPPASSAHGGKSRLAKVIDNIEGLSDPFWRLLKTYGPATVSRERTLYLNTPLDGFEAPSEWHAILSNPRYRSLHCHTTFDALRVHTSLQRLGRRKDVRLILTSHCPEMPGNEKADIMHDNGLSSASEKRVRAKLLAIDAAAFACADMLVFPCAEALEPYHDTYPHFGTLLAGKDVRYVMTGIDEPQCTQPATEAFPPSPETLKFFYAGRHNAVKGYDLLTATLPDFMDCADAVMVVAGKQGPLFAPSHLKWKELGWITNAPDLIMAADAFLLPNARTYFDIIALEVLAMGRPLLASRTGGNKLLAQLSSGVMLFDPTKESLLKTLSAFGSLSHEARQAMAYANRDAYNRFGSAECFARNYVSTVLAL
jgi:glycosyltransferase involved in cell wall biosynthesis